MESINMQAPSRSGSLYFNYNKTFRIVLLGSCDYRYKFTTVDMGAYGSQSDGGVFRHSIFGQRMEGSDIDIPLPVSNVPMP